MNDRRNPRANEDFNAVLYAQIRRTPWWAISVAFHAVLVLLMFNLATAGGSDFDAGLVQAVMDEYEELPIEEELPPEIQDVPPPDEPDHIPDPTPDDDRVAKEPVDDPHDNPVDQPLTHPLLRGDSPLQGPATNSEIGIGEGAGGGGPAGFGRRGFGASLVCRQRQKVVLGGLEWLKNHQSRDGFWDCDNYHSKCRDVPCEGSGRALYDSGVTGLALLAFLGAGETHRHGRYKDVVLRGLRYLKQIQDPEGCFGPRTDGHFIYNHAICALAMTEAYALTGSPLFKQSAQQAIDFCHRSQNPYLAWRYGVRPQDNDTSVTGWMVMALKSAKMAGLRVADDALDGARTWIAKATEPEYGRVGYTARGTGPARPEGSEDRWPAARSESLTAVGVLSRVFLGEDPKKSEAIGRGVDLMLKAVPVWDEESGAIDMYYWYYGTLAMFQVGGEPWKKWLKAMEPAIAESQRPDGCAKGSWDPVGPWGGEGGRVYSTALMVMCMEVFYRYDRVFGASSLKRRAKKK
ncbi:MAG: prenyltransferase/squalene oxidase repeat-containing protein [Planctomycetota bacterium]